LLIAHLGGLLLFTGLSWFLFESHPTGFSGDVTVVSWVASSLLAIVLAALAFVPAVFWLQLIVNSGAALLYGLTAGVVACLLGRYAWALWRPLSRASFALVRAILHPFIPGLISNPATLVIGSQTFLVAITPECSGYEGVGLVLTFSVAWLWFLRHEWRFPRAFLLLPAGAIAIWVFNALRIAVLILIGNAGAPRIALGGFHSQAGWITFTTVTIGLCLLARRLPWLTRIQSVESRPSCSVAHNPATPYLIPFLTILAATLISRSATADFEWLYPLRVLTAAVTLWSFRSTYQKLDWRGGWFALAIGSLVFCVWVALDYLSRGAQSAAIPTALAESSRAARFTWLAFRVAGALVTVPIAEELAYRGFLMRRLTSRDFESVGWRNFEWIPFLISSAAFGVLHGERWLGGTVAGLAYAYALVRRGRIGDAVTAHATTNGLVAAWVLLAGHWQMWGF
jgi:exosortase E/protease (VPEID-CTERM system)